MPGTHRFRAQWILRAARCRVHFDVAGIKCPEKKTARRVKEIPGLRWRVGPAVATGNDMLTLNRGSGFVVRLFEHAAQDVFAVPSRSEG